MEAVVKEKEYRTSWADCGQVFFCGGKGYGLTVALQTICLGKEGDIQKCLDMGEVGNEFNPVQRQVLNTILEYRKEITANARTVETKRPGDFRSRPAGGAEHRAAGTKRPAIRKRIPGSKA